MSAFTPQDSIVFELRNIRTQHSCTTRSRLTAVLYLYASEDTVVRSFGPWSRTCTPGFFTELETGLTVLNIASEVRSVRLDIQV